MSEYKWKGAINAFLPNDIYIKNVEKETETFHARHCVKQKEYEYHIMTTYDVFKKDYASFIPYELDIEKMKEASKCFIGKHDFTSFNSSSLEEYHDQVRTISEISIVQNEEEIVLNFIGKGFLRYMVRMMVAALIEVGKGKMTKEDISSLLDNPSKTAFSKNAEAQGLTLKRVDYFKILSLNEEGMIRERLRDDDISDDINYVFTTRNTQEILGYLKDDFSIVVFDDKNNKLADELMKNITNNQ